MERSTSVIGASGMNQNEKNRRPSKEGGEEELRLEGGSSSCAKESTRWVHRSKILGSANFMLITFKTDAL